MEKKQLISVVKPLIAAALLFGSSGGVAWGQAMHGHDTGGPYTHANRLCGNYTIARGGWSNPDNNFGPGETGTITPNGPNAGFWGGSVSWSNLGNGRVTVGNTNNIVVNAANAASVGGVTALLLTVMLVAAVTCMLQLEVRSFLMVQVAYI